MKTKYCVCVEHASGEPFDLRKWCKSALKYQDMDAWRRDNPQDFRRNVEAWLKGQLIVAIENLDVVLRELA